MCVITMEQTGNSNKAIVRLDGLRFVTNTATRPGVSFMKPIHTVSSFGLDRLATWGEVMRAISVSSEGVLTPGGADSDLRETDSDFRGRSRNLLEDDLWLAIVRETPDSKSN
jgi:hypothetical protein